MIEIKTLVQVVGAEFLAEDADGELETHLNKGYEILNIVVSDAETVYHEDDSPEVSFTRVVTLKREKSANALALRPPLTTKMWSAKWDELLQEWWRVKTMVEREPNELERQRKCLIAYNALLSHTAYMEAGVPQTIVDAYEAYLKANDDDSVSMDEFKDVRMALIDAVGDAVNAQIELQ